MCLRLLSLGTFAALSFAARAQVMQVSGGTSTLDQASGGQVSIRGPGYGASLGGGSIGGSLYGGGRVYRQFEQGTLSAGTEEIAFDLPTDLFEAGHYLTGLGVSYRSSSETSHTYVFAGATSTGYNTPFFAASAAEDAAVIVQASDKVGDGEISALALLSQRPTLLGSFAWKAEGGRTLLALTTGIGAGEPYSAASVSTHRRLWDLDASYIAASGRFRRTLVRTPMNSEPDRENVQLAVRVSPHAGFTVSRQNLLSPVYQSDANTRSSVTQATGNLQLAGVNLVGTVSDSSNGLRSNLASFVSASRPFGSRTDVQVAYLVSRPSFTEQSAAFAATVRQTLSPRWNVGGVLNSSGGQLGYGGSVAFLSNFATISADSQFFYVPARLEKPFERALILNVQMHLFGRMTVSGTSFVAPNGKLLYTTGGSGLLSHVAFEGTAGAATGHNAIGRMVMRGRVITIGGEPIAGAALWIDRLPVYTDSRGRFEVREQKAHPHTLELRGGSFLEGGLYRAVSSSAIAWSRPMANAVSEEIIVVQRVLPSQSGGAP